MAHAQLRERQTAAVLEVLEDRRLFSVSLGLPTLSSTPVAEFVSGIPISILPPTPTPGPIPTPINQGGVTLHEQPGVSFTAIVGTFHTIAPGNNLHASIAWGDGTAPSAGVIAATGVSGVDVIKFSVTGSHTYAQSGTYPIRVTVTQSLGPPGSLTPVSAGPIRLITTIRSTAIVAPSESLNLDGTISGKYSLAPSAVSIGAVYVFNGTGSAGALGPVQANGKVALPSPVAASALSEALGSLTLTSIGASPLVSGSVTLHLIGPTQTSADPFPTTLSYVISGGTGAFTGATGSGTIDVALDPTTMTFTFTIHST